MSREQRSLEKGSNVLNRIHGNYAPLGKWDVRETPTVHEDFFRACKRGDTVTVRRILHFHKENGVRANFNEDGGLFAAIRGGHEQTVSLLLNTRVPHAPRPDSRNGTALIEALCYTHDTDIPRILLSWEAPGSVLGIDASVFSNMALKLALLTANSVVVGMLLNDANVCVGLHGMHGWFMESENNDDGLDVTLIPHTELDRLRPLLSNRRQLYEKSFSAHMIEHIKRIDRAERTSRLLHPTPERDDGSGLYVLTRAAETMALIQKRFVNVTPENARAVDFYSSVYTRALLAFRNEGGDEAMRIVIGEFEALESFGVNPF